MPHFCWQNFCFHSPRLFVYSRNFSLEIPIMLFAKPIITYSLGALRLSKRLPEFAALFTATSLGLASPVLGGEATAPTKRTADKTVVEKKPPPNPLCFLDGKVCFDIQERL